MSDIAAAVIYLTGLAASIVYLIWWGITAPKRRKPYCDLCDIEGPHLMGETAYAWLDAHRVLHQLGRELVKPFERLLDKLARSANHE